jgi:hypothetical protein
MTNLNKDLLQTSEVYRNVMILLNEESLPEEMTYYFTDFHSGNPCFGRFKTKKFSVNGKLEYEKISSALGFEIEVYPLKDENLIEKLKREGNFFI